MFKAYKGQDSSRIAICKLTRESETSCSISRVQHEVHSVEPCAKADSFVATGGLEDPS